jgi:hypothetical protein
MRLREILLRRWRRFWQWRSRLLPPTPSSQQAAAEAEVRARFWDGVREGRREAEVRSLQERR